MAEGDMKSKKGKDKLSKVKGGGLYGNLLARAERNQACYLATGPEPRACDEHLKRSLEHSIIRGGMKISVSFDMPVRPPAPVQVRRKRCRSVSGSRIAPSKTAARKGLRKGLRSGELEVDVKERKCRLLVEDALQIDPKKPILDTTGNGSVDCNRNGSTLHIDAVIERSPKATRISKSVCSPVKRMGDNELGRKAASMGKGTDDVEDLDIIVPIKPVNCQQRAVTGVVEKVAQKGSNASLASDGDLKETSSFSDDIPLNKTFIERRPNGKADTSTPLDGGRPTATGKMKASELTRRQKTATKKDMKVSSPPRRDSNTSKNLPSRDATKMSHGFPSLLSRKRKMDQTVSNSASHSIQFTRKASRLTNPSSSSLQKGLSNSEKIPSNRVSPSKGQESKGLLTSRAPLHNSSSSKSAGSLFGARASRSCEKAEDEERHQSALNALFPNGSNKFVNFGTASSPPNEGPPLITASPEEQSRCFKKRKSNFTPFASPNSKQLANPISSPKPPFKQVAESSTAPNQTPQNATSLASSPTQASEAQAKPTQPHHGAPKIFPLPLQTTVVSAKSPSIPPTMSNGIMKSLFQSGTGAAMLSKKYEYGSSPGLKSPLSNSSPGSRRAFMPVGTSSLELPGETNKTSPPRAARRRLAYAAGPSTVIKRALSAADATKSYAEKLDKKVKYMVASEKRCNRAASSAAGPVGNMTSSQRKQSDDKPQIPKDLNAAGGNGDTMDGKKNNGKRSRPLPVFEPTRRRGDRLGKKPAVPAVPPRRKNFEQESSVFGKGSRGAILRGLEGRSSLLKRPVEPSISQFTSMITRNVAEATPSLPSPRKRARTSPPRKVGDDSNHENGCREGTETRTAPIVNADMGKSSPMAEAQGKPSKKDGDLFLNLRIRSAVEGEVTKTLTRGRPQHNNENIIRSGSVVPKGRCAVYRNRLLDRVPDDNSFTEVMKPAQIITAQVPAEQNSTKNDVSAIKGTGGHNVDPPYLDDDIPVTMLRASLMNGTGRSNVKISEDDGSLNLLKSVKCSPTANVPGSNSSGLATVVEKASSSRPDRNQIKSPNADRESNVVWKELENLNGSKFEGSLQASHFPGFRGLSNESNDVPYKNKSTSGEQGKLKDCPDNVKLSSLSFATNKSVEIGNTEAESVSNERSVELGRCVKLTLH